MRAALRAGESYHVVPPTRAPDDRPAPKGCDLFEVSTPELDDVVRLEDRYGRVGTESSGSPPAAPACSCSCVAAGCAATRAADGAARAAAAAHRRAAAPGAAAVRAAGRRSRRRRRRRRSSCSTPRGGDGRGPAEQPGRGRARASASAGAPPSRRSRSSTTRTWPSSRPGADAHRRRAGARRPDGDAAEAAEEPTADGKDEEYWRERGLEIRQRWRDAVEAVDAPRRRGRGAAHALLRRGRSLRARRPDQAGVGPRARPSSTRRAARRRARPDELDGFLEEGRRAGALPGWLREGVELEPIADARRSREDAEPDRAGRVDRAADRAARRDARASDRPPPLLRRDLGLPDERAGQPAHGRPAHAAGHAADARGRRGADVILLNSCSVREKAEQKVYSRLGEYRLLKRERPGLLHRPLRLRRPAGGGARSRAACRTSTSSSDRRGWASWAGPCRGARRASGSSPPASRRSATTTSTPSRATASTRGW